MQEKLKLEQKTKFTPRPITHQRFANLSLFNVQRALKNPDWNNYDKLRRIIGVDPKGAKDGDFLFYPSTKGTAYLGLCIRLFRRDNTVPVFQKLDLMETKSHKSGNSLALGTPLKLQHFSFLREDETLFDDLDEVQVRFIRPYTALCAPLHSLIPFSVLFYPFLSCLRLLEEHIGCNMVLWWQHIKRLPQSQHRLNLWPLLECTLSSTRGDAGIRM